MNDTSIQQSLFEEQNIIEKSKMYDELHKKAFRVAFDFLSLHFPPHNTPEWWEMFHDDIALVYWLNKDNELCKQLLYAILNYSEIKAKEFKENGHT